MAQRTQTSQGLLTEFPADLRLLAEARPVYETMPGWSTPSRGVTQINRLPTEARRYIERLEEVSGVECAIVSTGSDRDETIVAPGSAAAKWLSV